MGGVAEVGFFWLWKLMRAGDAPVADAVDLKRCSNRCSEVYWMAGQGVECYGGGAKACITEIRWRWPVEAEKFIVME